ncbi:MAG: type VI secretion system-associated FHA domain protein TagH [Albidovulum sp.]|uniref:type VI secretion system-associated FHA domain protein TagH n=1 Tax=Albidovulum sp. TaxID=1872424 RepID=UPI003C7FBAF8
MTLRLIVEHSLHPQPRPEMRHISGELSIGRGADCDWPIDDPDMFVSRRHCVISEDGDTYTVTDASRGGLFIDGADTPLGAGNSVALTPGMRLRMGDVVIRVEMGPTPSPEKVAPKPATASDFDADDFFARRDAPEPTPPRPGTLPEPFEGKPATPHRPEKATQRVEFDGPFTLDPLPAHGPESTKPADTAGGFSFNDFFDEAESARPEPEQQRPASAPKAPQTSRPDVPQPAPDADERAFHAALFRGLGLDPKRLQAEGTEEEMEALGRRYRLLVEGLVHLLRTRSKEKGSVRVAQTVIGSADVNPLKFLATTDDALTALIAPKGAGYLPPEEAINGAFRDLSDHQLRTWTAVQSALRRMIDRFDPAEIEREAEAEGLMKALLSGGRSARLWQLYTDRYRDIARAAEDRFLGEVGSDFRDAYEGMRRTGDD